MNMLMLIGWAGRVSRYDFGVIAFFVLLLHSFLHRFQMCFPVVLAHIRQRTHLAPRHSSHANLAAVTDQVDVEGIVVVRGNELTKNLVSFFIRRFLRHPAEALGDAKDVRVHREPVCH